MLTHHVKQLDIDKPTILLLHGFISDHTTFHLVEDAIIKQGINVISIDLPGHGDDKSSYDKQWSMEFIADKIKELIAHLELKTVYLHGYSMGGRVALSFAIQYPEWLNGLILESASPGIENNKDKLNRIEVDKTRAEYIQNIGMTKFVEEWSQLSLFESQSILSHKERNRIKKMRLSQSPGGLSKALIDYGTGAQRSYWDKLNDLDLPTCIIVGEKDKKFIEIGKRMHECIKNSKFQIVNDAGHTIHVEQPEKFDTIIIEFILGGKLCQDNGKL
ncbi:MULTISPECIES: 2-succinyl-6-hydroxy-2,4-cyclohexadiene-1-carboxylate synthase [Mammaliicoccus]|uniref:Putative 2-succinyl-6-hydroxy-2,4-cyclohexadiene-1-carboxylate synthase n=1 Tax=Mammaliicoccus fleurettii TaxID=150056 RepID=A0ABS5MLR0_9STAP|nr:MULTISPECIES: 2-succinyl-6-hydroxy-2,4-cyclohexadiene-1-carboxylate synthase [Mammaliicoccus]MBL0847476.1 2-succinyl-6-hydroxy-2,4-cyclohexadiene-1-carboxylate synthase [Mammaliicoccus fleurettii]MBO3063075.1 2-succinyl-6-hydroxy-2,4-cyclohexadiene-1-carboxylate synthase [Mammaliicoccus fleurettii]MBS3671647.1 2-succinyl-6-hydroxy-2,4-cyclohexadiene-1-carboxylate synthase [Mammaliicoccus fleurettii]MBS3696202.1 2-succinyl-6-hydroxy-2,4-cyclohexadiene-1-carboxylate synthase [Mammaliicoccus fl